MLSTRTLPSAAALVQKSITMGSSPLGMPTASGLVLKREALPHGGDTRCTAPWLLTIIMPTRPSATANSQYSPRRPTWPEQIIVPTPTPVFRAFFIRRSVRRRAWTRPHPQWASAVNVPGPSRSTSKGAPGTISPFSTWVTYCGIRISPCES